MVQKHTGFRLTETQLQSLDVMVEKGIFPNRAEAIREAVRGIQEKYKIYGPQGGAVTCPAQ